MSPLIRGDFRPNRDAGPILCCRMSPTDPQAAQVAAHQHYLDALDRLDEAEESGDRSRIRKAKDEVERAKKEWHRRLAEGPQRKRGE